MTAAAATGPRADAHARQAPDTSAAGIHGRPRRPVQGSVILGLMPSQPQPQATWAALFPVAGTSPARARFATGLFLSNCRGIPDGLGDVAALLVSELVTNAYKAMNEEPFSGIACVELSLRLFGDRLLIEVIDSSPKPPVPNLAENAQGEGGRGLAVVDGLSEEWGYFWRTDRKVVYCTLPYTPEKIDKETEDGQPFCPVREHD
jgi:anti-sigma regulatory factor (Ser/Thr protein kinase)